MVFEKYLRQSYQRHEQVRNSLACLSRKRNNRYCGLEVIYPVKAVRFYAISFKLLNRLVKFLFKIALYIITLLWKILYETVTGDPAIYSVYFVHGDYKGGFCTLQYFNAFNSLWHEALVYVYNKHRDISYGAASFPQCAESFMSWRVNEKESGYVDGKVEPLQKRTAYMCNYIFCNHGSGNALGYSAGFVHSYSSTSNLVEQCRLYGC